MDGIELAQLLQEGLDLAIVFLTGHTDQPTLARARLARPLGFVTKPFGQAELLSSIERALRESRDGIGDGVVAQLDGESVVRETEEERSNEPS